MSLMVLFPHADSEAESFSLTLTVVDRLNHSSGGIELGVFQ